MSLKLRFVSDISERNNDYSDTLDFRRGWVGELGMVTFLVLKVPDYESAMLIYLYIYIHRVIHLKCPKYQELRRIKDAFNPPTKFAMWLCRHQEIHGNFFSSIASVLNEMRNIKDEKWFWQYLNVFSLWKNIRNLTEMLNCYW